MGLIAPFLTMEIKGFTTINHAVRAKLSLSLQEYAILDFLYNWQMKFADVPKKDDWYSALGIDNNKDSVIVLISDLSRKGYLDLNHKITKMWSDEFIASAQLGDDFKTANKAKNSRSKSISIKKQFIPPFQKECSDYFFKSGYDPNAGIEFWKYYDAGSWTDSNGKQIINWKQKAITVWFKPNNLLPAKTDNDIKKLVM